MFRIVIRFHQLKQLHSAFDRIDSAVAKSGDVVQMNGLFIEVLTSHPGRFLSGYFEKGFTNSFTCERM